MLILMRRAGESIHIGHDIVITLISLEHNRARIGIEAPKSIEVHRNEIYERIKRALAGNANGNVEEANGNTT